MDQKNDSISTPDDEQVLSSDEDMSSPKSHGQIDEQNQSEENLDSPKLIETNSNSNQNEYENNKTSTDSSPDENLSDHHDEEQQETTETSEEEPLVSPDPPKQKEEEEEEEEEEKEEEAETATTTESSEEEILISPDPPKQEDGEGETTESSADEPFVPPNPPKEEEEEEVVQSEASIPVEKNLLEENSEKLVNDENPFHLSSTQSNEKENNDKPDEFKSQRDLDEDEIPPANLSSRNSISSEKRLSQCSQPIVDQDQQEQQDDEEDEEEEEDEDEEEKENADPLKMNGEIHLEKLSFDQIEKRDVEINEEILPPLETRSIAQEILHDEILLEEILNENPSDENKSNEEEKIEENLWEDILSNRTLMKKIIRKGRTNSRPTRSQLVTVNYSLFVVDKETSEEKLIEILEREEFFVGETDIISAIDLTVQSMDEGESATIISDVRHVYGNEGFFEKEIPPKTDENDYQMKIVLELIQFLPPPNVEHLSADERFRWADKKRQNGNIHYRRKDYSSSLQCYRGCLRFLDLENNPLRNDSTDEDQKKIIEQFIQVQNNVAQVNLILKRYDLCLNAVENVFKFDRKNIKALFRQGKSLFELGQYDQCQLPLKTILQLDPNHSDKDQILKMISTAEQKLANYQQNEKEIYRRMFQSTPSTTTTTATATTTTTNGSITNSSKAKTRRNLVLKKSSSTTFWTYLGLGSVTLGLVGLFAYFKYRKPSSTF